MNTKVIGGAQAQIRENLCVLWQLECKCTLQGIQPFIPETKQIGVQYHFVREVMENKNMDLRKIHIKENLAGVMIKPTNTDNFVWSRSSCVLAET